MAALDKDEREISRRPVISNAGKGPWRGKRAGSLPARALRWRWALALAAGLMAGANLPAETRTGEIDGYRYRLFVPQAPSAPSGRPLVVVLHGCSQNASDIARLSRFDVLAERSGFAVLYPETGPSLDNPYGCWRWWVPENQLRKGGEPEVIVTMAAEAGSAVELDRRRVYVAGFSSGGAMSAILGALYPDVFAAVGVHSGIPYSAAATLSCTIGVLSGGAERPESGATIAYHAQGRRHRIMPLVVVQGDEDGRVAAVNAERLIRQFAQLNDLADDGDGENQSMDAVADATADEQKPDGRSYQIIRYHDARGREIMRKLVVAGMGHAWSGGPAGEKYSDPGGPDVTSSLWRFFQNWSLENPPLTTRDVAECRERHGANSAHYWWHGRMSREQYRCDPWGWTWRREFDGEWTQGRCP